MLLDGGKPIIPGDPNGSPGMDLGGTVYYEDANSGNQGQISVRILDYETGAIDIMDRSTVTSATIIFGGLDTIEGVDEENASITVGLLQDGGGGAGFELCDAMFETQTIPASTLINGTYTISVNNLPNTLDNYGYCAYKVTENSEDYVYHKIWI